MRIAQRLVAFLLIFAIWMFIYFSFSFLKNPPAPPKLQFPESTVSIIKINNPKIISEFAYQLSFNNEDPKVLKSLSEFYQNINQGSLNNFLPIQFNSPVYFLKILSKNRHYWFIAGIYNGQKSNEIKGFIKNQYFFYLLNPDDHSKGVFNELAHEKWNNLEISSNNTFNYWLFNKGKLINNYACTLDDNGLTILFKNTINPNSLSFNEEDGGFHLTTFVDPSNDWPIGESGNNFIKNITSISINYYGAENRLNEKSSYVQLNFDALIKLNKQLDSSDISSFLNFILPNAEIKIFKNHITYFNNTYYYHFFPDSTMYLGKSKDAKRVKSNSIKIKGNPSIITEVKNLGEGWQTFLDSHPVYRITRDFTSSISNITNETVQNDGKIRIRFKPHINPTLEAFKLFSTFVNEASIEN
jgi:hypothetical protein